MGISGVLTDESSWKCTADSDKGIFGTQIDLVIDRNDRVKKELACTRYAEQVLIPVDGERIEIILNQ